MASFINIVFAHFKDPRVAGTKGFHRNKLDSRVFLWKLIMHMDMWETLGIDGGRIPLKQFQLLKEQVGINCALMFVCFFKKNLD